MNLTPYIKEAAKQYIKMRGGTATQEEVAPEIGVSAQALRSWEQGKSEPKVSKFIGLCRSLGYEAHEVLYAIEHPDKVSEADTAEEMREAIVRYVRETNDTDFLRGAYTITNKMRRSAIMQLFLAYMALPLRNQQMLAWIIMDQYEFCHRFGGLREDLPEPNLETLKTAHQMGRAAAMMGENNYIMREE